MTYLNTDIRKKIILGILNGQADEAFTEYALDDVTKAAMIAAAHRAVRAGVGYQYPFKRYATAKRRVPLLVGYLASGAVLTLLAACAIWLHVHIDYTSKADYPLVAAMVALLGFFAATAGWTVSSWTSGRNARAQHTINVLANRYSNTLYSDAAATFNDAFGDLPVTAAKVKALIASTKQADKEALQSLRYLLNWFEFVSAGVQLGDLDIVIVKHTVRSNLLFYYERCSAYILTEQAKNPRILRNLVQLASHFRSV